MISVAVSKSISACNTNTLDELISGDKILITNETDALEILISYFSEKINCQYCQTCQEDRAYSNQRSNRREIFRSKTQTTPAHLQPQLPCINTCYNTAVQVQIAEFFRCFDLNFDKKLTYHEFYKGFTSLFFNQTNDGIRSYLNENKAPYYIWIDENAIRNLFLKFDLNQDGYVDFSKLRLNYLRKEGVIELSFDLNDLLDK